MIEIKIMWGRQGASPGRANHELRRIFSRTPKGALRMRKGTVQGLLLSARAAEMPRLARFDRDQEVRHGTRHITPTAA